MKIKLLLLAITTMLIISCKKEVITQTQSQVSASNLAKALGVEQNKLYSGYSIVVTNSSNSMSNNGSSLMITSDGFIIISSATNGSTSSVTYNLGEMKSYQIMNFSTIKDLYLYY
ncbi:hypothetical protein [Rhizosphaericola mali]|uniref:Uncharacterized protein n=1 Tax=Rhizosphaericola mali TaxID=2545455 RepID=A0A5P2GFY0_9BACT|nr:hypothetical protein [Rhizosphaericola mali]QES90561.1 hypothetical protein E0W69_018490 [Rhizosphaericola mali]